MSAIESHESNENFSLVLGGPLFHLFRRTYLSGSCAGVASPAHDVCHSDFVAAVACSLHMGGTRLG